MFATIKKAVLKGEYTAPPSKSDTHRALICGALANGFSYISPINSSSKDIEATLNALQLFESKIQLNEDVALVQGISGTPQGNIRIFCGESASTLRFLLPVAAAFGIEAVFTGTGGLSKRPLALYHELLECKGVTLDRLESDELPLKICGKLHAGKFYIRGDISSQFISGLLFALPLLTDDSEIILTSKLESKPYVDMTLETLRLFGIKAFETNNGYKIAGGQHYTPCTYHVEGDYSNAAYFAVAGLLSNGLSICGLSPSSKQGDSSIFKILKLFGANIAINDDKITVSKSKLCGASIDAAQIPDLVPILAVLGTFAEGETLIYGAHRLRLKESDRLKSITEALSAVGADIHCDNDSIKIHGGKPLRGGVVSSYNDHRIVMSMAVAALYCDEEIIIDGAESVKKSYPNFFSDYNKLGGCADVRLG
ncbi:MAG: 3-phosphoshikimate 1-carboxyvinyltransferase [Hydrogenoanaerobacterium sp.]